MDKEKIIKISKKLLPLLLPAGLGTAMQISEGIKEIIESNVNKDLNQIKLETAKQELIFQQLIAKAHFEQEMAISVRIAMSQEVQIDEYYDISGEGSIGASAKNSNGSKGTSETEFTLGASGSGKKVTKRTYKFIGYRDESDINITQVLDENGDMNVDEHLDENSKIE
jgi:hypothetical protein